MPNAFNCSDGAQIFKYRHHMAVASAVGGAKQYQFPSPLTAPGTSSWRSPCQLISDLQRPSSQAKRVGEDPCGRLSAEASWGENNPACADKSSLLVAERNLILRLFSLARRVEVLFFQPSKSLLPSNLASISASLGCGEL